MFYAQQVHAQLADHFSFPGSGQQCCMLYFFAHKNGTDDLAQVAWITSSRVGTF